MCFGSSREENIVIKIQNPEDCKMNLEYKFLGFLLEPKKTSQGLI